MRRLGIFLGLCITTAAVSALDLSQAALAELPGRSRVEAKAADLFNIEVAKRTRIRPARHKPDSTAPLILIGTKQTLAPFLDGEAKAKMDELRSPESYRIWMDQQGGTNRLMVAGSDDRGALFGTGYLLRQLSLERGKIDLPDGFEAAGAPKMPLRGHQLGYRQKTNSYDGWDVPQWEQYFRDLVIFGCNAIELIPPRSDDDPDSPHFPLPPMEMMVEMSRLADDYGMDVWVWYPAMDPDYSDPKTVQASIEEWSEVFRQLPRLDAVFVPGGDPGHTQPKHLFKLLEKQAANLRRSHPHATLWVSPQSFGGEWMNEFLELVLTEPDWLGGIVYGPQVRVPLAELRSRIPQRYAIRDYPDITHSRHCQYPVPNWDVAYAVTEGRETINPRPTQMQTIFRATTARHSIGFITYSEGCNDDVNKAIWSALGWDPETDVRDVLRDYSRYFIGQSVEDDFRDLLLGLEQNYIGAVSTNACIESNLALAKRLETVATPAQKLNWRFQQALYRAYYDAFVARRLKHETAVEAEAMDQLRAAHTIGSIPAMSAAESTLERGAHQPIAADLRGRLFELGEALFQSIHMQLSTERYQGEEGRGSNLNEVDHPLNNRLWLGGQFATIRQQSDETARLAALQRLVDWQDPGPGGFYDDLGNPARQPHLVTSHPWTADPGFFHSVQTGFTATKWNGQHYPVSWWTSAENLYDEPIRMRYEKLDRSARYKLRLVYGAYKNNAPVRLMANNNLEIHPWLNKAGEILEFDLPPESTANGNLELTWFPTPGRGGNGRILDIAEVWLVKSDRALTR